MNSATRLVKNELSRVPITAMVPAQARLVEVTAMLRFGGGVVREGAHVRLHATFDSAAAALRLRSEIMALHGRTPRVVTVESGRMFHVCLTRDAAVVAANMGLLDVHGRTVPRFPIEADTYSPSAVTALMRGAVLARGLIIAGPRGGAYRLEVACPDTPAAAVLVECFDRNAIKSSRDSRAVGGEFFEMVSVRRPRQVTDLLSAIGAPAAARILFGKARTAPTVATQL